MLDLLRFENVKKQYGRNIVLNNLNFGVENNSIVGLLGENGAGKTTLMKIALTFTTPDSGEVFLKGKHISQLKEKSNFCSSIGFMLEPRFYANLSLYENLKLFSILGGEKKNSKAIYDVIEMVNLSDVKDKKIGSFSYGMKQRYSLAMAMLMEPELLLLDEPLVGLDPDGVEIFKEKIIELQQKKGCTVLISSHQIADIEKICTSVAVLYDGKIVKQNKMEEILYTVHEFKFEQAIMNIDRITYLYGDEVWLSDNGKSIFIKNFKQDGISNIIDMCDGNHIIQINVVNEGLERYYNDRDK